MKQFSVYQSKLTGEIEVVKEGWSWLAFFFGGFYALFKKAWLQAVLMIVGVVILHILFKLIIATIGGDTESSGAVFWPSVVSGIVFGKFWNNWFVSSLLKRGFVLKTKLMATNQTHAQMQFMEMDKKG